jgi:hypothetical protein
MNKIYEIRAYSINDFREWKERGELILSPKFQRRRVWSEKAKSYLIDTILRGLPIPPIFIREKIDLSTKKTVREVIDGQQRLATILDYLNDGLKISKIHNEEYGGLYFSQLPEDIQNEILKYNLSVNIVLTSEDKEVLGIFARLNTYTVPLNKNELWNAKYFGLFKQTVHSLAHEYYTFWVETEILSEPKITRMGDVDLVSELVIASIDGIQDRRVIENYYKRYDDVFDLRGEVLKKFKSTMDTIGQIYYDSFKNSNFKSIPLFYTLFCVIYDFLFGLPGSNNERRISPSDYPKIKNILQDLDSLLGEEEKEIDEKVRDFRNDYQRHTTVKETRERRHKFLLKFIKDRLPNE